MRISEFLAAALLWQSALLVNIGTVAAPEHLRYQRELRLPAEAQGLACATLDAEVLARTASAAHNDLRIYRVYRSYAAPAAQAEVPYTLTESGPEPVAAADAPVTHVARSGGALQFDLQMPLRAYSEVELRLRTHNFVGTAVVTADDGHGGRKDLGTFGLFDLTTAGLGHWTVLPMAETSAPVLHVALSLRTPEGKPITALPLAIIAGAAVPPSRERQTVYTPVVSGAVQPGNGSSVAVLHVPAHVPVERLLFTLRPGTEENYFREVTVRAKTDGDPVAETEVMDAGAIQNVRWAPGDPRLNPIHVTQNSVDATTGATLGGKATVRVSVVNGTQPPLPIERVTLEMRERKVCFPVTPGTGYTLRYGDPALAAPIYDEASFASVKGAPVFAELGPETRNPKWKPRTDPRPYLDRHPEVFWLVVLACAGMMGGTALHFVQHRAAGGRV